jgi:NhaP-type Na+/H+ or K+/H+ antiporter
MTKVSRLAVYCLVLLAVVAVNCSTGIHNETREAASSELASRPKNKFMDPRYKKIKPDSPKTKTLKSRRVLSSAASGSAEGEVAGGNEHHSPSNQVIMVFTILGTLILSAFCREIKKMTGIPYTPLLLVAGMLAGGHSDMLWEFGQGLDLIMDIDPHAILLIFIPILVFEAAYNTDLYFFKKEFYQVLLLAGPGVAIGAVMLGFVFQYILEYGNEETFGKNIFGALTFSSIVCATDTVAVLALLKELGTPKYFSALFEGENLINDATAMVLYMVFSNLYKAKGMTAIGAVLQFLRLSLGGVVLGFVVFVVVYCWLSRITKDKILVITLTVVFSYLTFYLAENVVMVSGLISVVVLGVFMAMYSKMRMPPETGEMVHTVISFIQFCLESILFIITGVFIGKKFLFENKNTLDETDYTKSLLFFLFMNIARYLMINMLLPLINKTGYPLNWKDVIVLSYGGVRGALGLALALIIYRDPEYSNRFKDIVLFYISVVIVLTVIFNGLTIGFVMRLINFAPINPLTYKIKNNVLKNVVISTFKKQETIRNNKFLRLANWDEVKDMTGIEKLVKQQTKEALQIQNLNLKAVKQLENLSPNKQPLNIEDYDKTEVQEVRLRFYTLIKSVLHEKYEEDFCSMAALKEINEACETCIEELQKPMWLWEYVSQEIISVEQILSLMWWRNIPIISLFSSSWLSSFFLATYEKLTVIVMVLNQILEDEHDIPLNPAIIHLVNQEVYKNKAEFEKRLFHICDMFPEFIQNVQNKQAAQILLNSQKSILHDSYVSEEDFYQLSTKVDKEISRLAIKSYNWGNKEINELELIEPSFSKLNKDSLQRIRDSCIKCGFRTGQNIYGKGDPVPGIYIIIKGMVEDTLALDCKKTLGVGSIVSFANVVKADGKSLTNLNCIHDCMTYLVPRDVIMAIAEEDRNFQNYIYKSALEYYLRIYGEVGYNQKLNDNMISILVHSSEMITKQAGEMLSVDGGGFLYRGSLKPTAQDNFQDPRKVNLSVEKLQGEDGEEGEPSGNLSPTRSIHGANQRGRYGNGMSIMPRETLKAPMLLTPLLNGYYKVDEPVIFFAFKTGVLGDEFNDMGSMRFSVKNTMGASTNLIAKKNSLQKKLANAHDIDKEYAGLLEKNFPQYASNKE